MKRRVPPVLGLVIIGLCLTDAGAQQIPFLSELFSRYQEFNRLYNEKRREGASLAGIDGLRRRGEEAFKTFDIGGLLAVLGEGKALLEGKPWNDRERYISSLTLETDRLVLEPNQDLRISLTRMFPAGGDKLFPAQPTVTLLIAPFSDDKGPAGSALGLREPVVIAQRLQIAELGASFQRRLVLPDGRYWVLARLEAGPQKLAELKQPLFAIADFSDQLKELSSRVTTIKSSTDPRLKAVSRLLSTPEFQIQRLKSLNNSPGDDNIDVIDALDRLDDTLSALLRGQNPFLAQRGEIERAYANPEGKLVPYRLYVPAGYDGSSPRPLVVMLHGVMGDETMYFSLFDPAVIKGEGQRRGWLLVAPYGGGRFGGYREQGQADVFEVIKAVTSSYEIDPSRVYLTGHSMGASGAWLIAARQPEVFAAIAPVSGGAPVQQDDALEALLRQMKSIPALVVHGARDRIVPPQRSREMVAAAQKAGMKVEYLEVATADHVTVVAETFPAVMSFFEKIVKPVAQK